MSNTAKSVASVKLADSTAPVEQVVLFELNGREFTIPKKTRVNLGLKVMRITAKQGEQVAQDYMLEQLLGEEAYEALLDFDDLTLEKFNTIVDLASKVVFGDLEDPKGETAA